MNQLMRNIYIIYSICASCILVSLVLLTYVYVSVPHGFDTAPFALTENTNGPIAPVRACVWHRSAPFGVMMTDGVQNCVNGTLLVDEPNDTVRSDETVPMFVTENSISSPAAYKPTRDVEAV